MMLLCSLMTATMAVAAETRYYLIRGGQLPTDVETVDWRADHGKTTWALRNIYRSSAARYALFEKRADSWWQVAVNTLPSQPVDLSPIGEGWTLCMRLRRTVNYPLTLCLAGQTTAEGYTVTTTAVPADGQWHTLRVPLSSFGPLTLSESFSGSLVRLHSDLGYTGNEVGIDYCYLTTDATTLDPGQVQDETRYYLVSNSRTPRTIPYIMKDYSEQLSARYSGWMQWAYIPFPYYSSETAGAAAMQLCAMSMPALTGADEDWALVGQLMTDMQGALRLTLYMGGKAYTFAIAADALVRDGKTWNRLYLPLDEAQAGTYTDATFVLLSLSAENLTAGRLSLASLMLTNNHAAVDPDPVVPGDPANGQQIWLLNDGTALPANTNATDYRLFATDYLNVSYGNNATRKSSDPWLTLLPTNGWWSADVSAAKEVDLTPVKGDWTLYARIRTTSTYRPINLILYRPGNQQLYRYQLTADLLPTSSNGEWKDLEIPMSTFLGSETSLAQFSAGNRVFTIHSDGGVASGVEVSLEYLYMARQGESTPAPVPGETPLAEPEVTPIEDPVNPEGIETPALLGLPVKILQNGQLYIRRANEIYDLMGRSVR